MKDNSNVVIKCSFFDKNHPSWNWYTDNKTTNHKNKINASKETLKPISHIDYVGRKTACDIEINAKPGSYAAYINGDHNVKKVISEGHFHRGGHFTHEEWPKVKDSDKWKVSKKSLVWTPVISFRQDFQEMFKLVSKEDAAEVVRNTIDDFFKANKIDPNSMEYLGQFHVDKPHHFHIHLRIHQKYPGCHDWKTGKDKFRTKGKFSEQSLEDWKENISNELVKRITRFKGVNALRSELNYRVLDGLEDPKVINEITSLASSIKIGLKSGRFQYDGIKSIVVKTQVDLVVEKLINSKSESKKRFENLNKLIDDQIDLKITEVKKLSSNESIIKKLNELRESKKQEIWRHLANQALKQIKSGQHQATINKGFQSSKNFGQLKSRNKIFSLFSGKNFWDELDDSVKSEIQDIKELLDKSLKEIDREKEYEG